METSRDFTGKTEEEAISKALIELERERDEVSIELLERAKSGFLGIGASPAVIRVKYTEKDSDKKTGSEPAAVKESKVQKESSWPSFMSKKTSKTADKAVEAPAAAPEKDSEDNTFEDVQARALEFIGGLLERMSVDAQIEAAADDAGGIKIKLSGDKMGVVIGRRGETLDAIQHLTNYAANRGLAKRIHISVDAENYRQKREESLVRLAEKMAAKVLKTHRSMSLEPMNSYERHVIHSALQDYEGVSTSSTGSDPHRRVVISCAGSANQRHPREWK